MSSIAPYQLIASHPDPFQSIVGKKRKMKKKERRQRKKGRGGGQREQGREGRKEC